MRELPRVEGPRHRALEISKIQQGRDGHRRRSRQQRKRAASSPEGTRLVEHSQRFIEPAPTCQAEPEVLECVQQEGRILGCPGGFYPLQATLDRFLGQASPVECQGCASKAKRTNSAGTCECLVVHPDGCQHVAI